MNKPEKILCAAIHIDDGERYTNSPENIETGFIEVGLSHEECQVHLIRDRKLFLGARTDGFYTDKQRFVSRKEGFVIALEAKQINGLRANKFGQLYSSDIINY